MMTTNRVEFPIAVNAISQLGAAAVLLSPAWKAAEVDHALSLTGPVHAIADGAAVDLLRERGQEVEVLRFGDSHGRAAYVNDPDGNVVELWTWDVGEHLRPD